MASPSFHAIRSIKPDKKGISTIWRLLKTRLFINNLEVTNADKESLYPFALHSMKEEKIVVTDPVKCFIYVLQTEECCLSAFIQHIINIQGSVRSLDCLPLTDEKILISDATKDNNRLVLWDTVTNTCIKEIKDPLMS